MKWESVEISFTHYARPENQCIMVLNEVFIAEISNCLNKVFHFIWFAFFLVCLKWTPHFLFIRILDLIFSCLIFIQLTDMKTSSACWSMATRVHSNFFINLMRVGLCTVADGCVRNNVGNRLRSDSAGLDAP